jgi:3-hydroxyisobutyrate dehydrogenase-like beta-hydroxyacid dehydrogenase
MKLGFIGLGNMGQAMARNIARAGHQLTVYNRTRSRADELRAEGARVAVSPYDAALNADVLITMLANDEAVEAVIFGSHRAVRQEGLGALHGLRAGTVHISMSTIGVALSKRLAEAHAAAGQAYVAAPVFGRPDVAAAARLWIVAAGPADHIERCRPVFEPISQGMFTVGEEPWTANVVKLAGNFLIASMLEALGEAFALVRKSGVEVHQFLEISNSALFKSPLYETYGSIIADERYEPAGLKLALGLKDVRLALEAADAASAPMPLASLIRDHFLSAIAHGQGEMDWAGLARVIAEHAGLGEPKTMPRAMAH